MASKLKLVEIASGRVQYASKIKRVADRFDTIIYWMSRDQRVADNWSLLHAQNIARTYNAQLVVIFCLVKKFLHSNIRHFGFMMKGLQEVEQDLRALNIPFYLLRGDAKDQIPEFVQGRAGGVGALITDHQVLRVPLQWHKDVAQHLEPLGIPLIRVDAHNVVPMWMASEKQEYAARTIRPKIHRLLSTYLTDFPPMTKQERDVDMPEVTDWKLADESLEVNREVKEIDWCTPGSKAARQMLSDFIAKRLSRFGEKRNDPNANAVSNLSPYLHFGQISAQRCIWEANKQRKKYPASVDSFVEEILVRRELSDNFCYYNPNYDNIDGAADWAKTTLREHESDKRERLHTLGELEHGATYDDLWNAAQLQMVRQGRMHGFLRMYWAKKILEWTPSPKIALEIAIYLNDKYSIDGRDPNGYVGCAWSITGIHDQGWAERSIFGKIRFMNYQGCKRKFDIPTFVAKFKGASPSSSEWKKNLALAHQQDKQFPSVPSINSASISISSSTSDLTLSSTDTDSKVEKKGKENDNAIENDDGGDAKDLDDHGHEDDIPVKKSKTTSTKKSTTRSSNNSLLRSSSRKTQKSKP